MAIPLQSGESTTTKNELSSGERIVRVSEQGKPSETRFSIEERYEYATLVKASPSQDEPIKFSTHSICRSSYRFRR